MSCLKRLIRLLPIGLVFGLAAVVSPVLAASISDLFPGERPLRGVPSVARNDKIQAALTQSTAWRRFNSRFGRWDAIWNEETGTPHRAFGRGIALKGFSENPASVNASLKAFVASHPEVFRVAPTLEPLMIEKKGKIWYARYRQTVGGLPVLFTDWEFRIGPGGKLIAFGADARPTPRDVVTVPRITGAQALEAAKDGLDFDPATDRVEGAEQLYLVPAPGAGAEAFRLVYDVRVRTREPRGNWVTLVDAVNGDVVWRHNRVRYADVVGDVLTRVHLKYPTDILTTVPLRDLNVKVASTQVTTNPAGHYNALCGGTSTVTAKMSGPFLQILRADEEEPASFSRSGVSCPGTANFLWDQTTSIDAERDAYYHGITTHTWIKSVDPSYNASDYPMTIYVNSLDDECLAFFDGDTITLGADGSTCANMASVADLVYHEYMHRINDDLYESRGAPFGMENSVVHEACCDITAGFMQDEATIGDGLYGPGTHVRNLNDLRRWPHDNSAEPKEAGLILAGAFWELRNTLDLPTASNLAHFAKYGLPDDLDDGVAMSEYFVETLVVDDDDANLANGTPHSAQIIAAFNARNIGTNAFINIAHTALEDQPTAGPYPITAVIQYTGPISALDTNSPRLWYSANGTPWTSTPMTPTGNPDEWGAEIGAQSAAIVRYYIEAADLTGGNRTSPAAAPNVLNLFIAGPASTVFSFDMESDPGWTSGAPGDDATTGFWTRVVPVFSFAQPGVDHSLFGTMCWVTGNGEFPDDPPGFADVDDGKTTLLTNVFDATAFGLTFPIVSYWRWYSNNAGENPNTDVWQVDISNNGGSSWTNVENTTDTEQSWQRVIFFVHDYVTPTANMRMRFIASDYGDGSLVEGAVDDFDLIAFNGPVSSPAPAAVAPMALAPAAPNPFQNRTRLDFSLPVRGAVDLRVFDIHGRLVRTLVSGVQEAGHHAVDWDGLDERGRTVASGPYFLRLSHNGQQTTRGVVRIR